MVQRLARQCQRRHLCRHLHRKNDADNNLDAKYKKEKRLISTYICVRDVAVSKNTVLVDKGN